MILKGVLADVYSDVSKTLTQSAQDERLVMTGQVSFLLRQDPRHLGVIRLGMLILDRFVLGAPVIGHSCLLFIGYVMSVGPDCVNDYVV